MPASVRDTLNMRVQAPQLGGDTGEAPPISFLKQLAAAERHSTARRSCEWATMLDRLDKAPGVRHSLMRRSP